MPTALLGVYHRLDSTPWRLMLDNCTYLFTSNGAVEGKGDYTLTSGDATSGEIVLSNDQGCHGPGQQDLPTPYLYTFDGKRLTFQVKGGHDADLCTGRPEETAAPRVWRSTPNGAISIVYNLPTRRSTRGAFALSGAASDRGLVTVKRPKVKRRTVHLTTTFRGAAGTIKVEETIPRRGHRTWLIVDGTGLYDRATGEGTEVATKRSRGVHVVLSGTILT